jgi:hydrogenase nickel incorporation protein HypA/HybF
MHELALARDLLAAIERKLDRGEARVVRVRVSVGAAAGVVPEALRFAFRAVCERTRVDGADLSIVTIAARSRCADCGIVFEFDGLIGRCPGCGRLGGELLSGDDVILRAIEVADV